MKRRLAAGATAIAIGVGVAAGQGAHAQILSDPFAACHEQLRLNPDDYDSAFCFYAAAFERRLWDEGARTLEGLIRARPANFWLLLAYGHLQRNRAPDGDPDAAEALYRRAADAFRSAGHAEGEILARSNLRDILVPRGRVSDAAREVALVADIAAASADRTLQARAWTLQATHTMETGGDLGTAYRLLKQTQRAIFPDGPYRLRRTCLTSLGLVAFRMGRVDEALDIFRQLEGIARREGDAETRANAQYNILNTESLRESLLPSPGARERLIALARETLAAGTDASHAVVTLKSHRALASLMVAAPDAQDDALRHAERCLALAAAARQRPDEAACAWLEAALLHDRDPSKAGAARIRALEATAAANIPSTDAASAGRHMRLAWRTGSRPDAVRESLAAIDAIETLRALQEGDESAAALFSVWTLDYYWLSGRLLDDVAADIDLAFSVTERMRARTLLEVRQRSRAPAAPGGSAQAAREAALHEIAAVQRALMDPRLAGFERQLNLDRLSTLEAREQDAERRIATAARNAGSTPSFADLRAVQSALGHDEALLSFQLGIWEAYDGDFGGGSWLISITRDQRAVYRLPDRTHFAPLVPVFNGLLGGRDGIEAAAARLYRDVFSTALADLPAVVRRLVIVPDGPLQHLAFDALRADRRAEPLAARYQLSVAPSATLWLEWRRAAAPAAGRRAIVLADPELGNGENVAAERRAVLERGLALGRLPHARRESQMVARILGDVDALVGSGATEHAIKTRDLRAYEIVHFAAHAVADEAHPERSAVFLAPGADSEDGLLQAREIGDLALDGRIVVLSACRTAAGTVLSGEGVLSLARAFFEAGARTVIGTRWPVRDADAAWVFERFYEELGRGASVSEALARVKVATIDAGYPAEVWAGLVLLGDGAARPFAAGLPVTADRRRTILLIVLAVGLLGAAARVVRSRTPPTSMR